MKALLIFCILFSLIGFADDDDQNIIDNSALTSNHNLSDQEEKESESYIHQGKTARLYEEECANSDGVAKEECVSEEAFREKSFGSTLDTMLPIVTKMYALMGLTGGGGMAPKTEGGDSVGKACDFIAVGVEAVTLATQQANNKQNQQILDSAPPQSAQRASFETLAKTHQDRAKSSKVQAIGWTAVTACYTAVMIWGGASGNWKNYAKVAGSALISTFYYVKSGAHKKRANLAKEMARKLPGAGDCNPHTDTSCFCSEETSYAADPANFLKYCVPQELHRENNVAGLGCVNASGKADLSCKCKKNNSCIHAKLASQMVALGLDPAKIKNPMEGISHLSTGLAGANMDSLAKSNSAFAQNQLKKYKPSSDLNLNKGQTQLAKGLLKAGLPKAIAASLAKDASGLKGVDLPSFEPPGKLAALVPQKNSYSSPSSANKLKSGSSSSRPTTTRAATNPFARKSFNSNKTSKVDIMEFAEKATREAEITKDPGKPLFDIISYRYQMRAWKEFDDEMKKSMGDED